MDLYAEPRMVVPTTVRVKLRKETINPNSGLFEFTHRGIKKTSKYPDVQFSFMSPFDIHLLFIYYLDPLEVENVKVELNLNHD